jgi:hypothetical protein
VTLLDAKFAIYTCVWSDDTARGLLKPHPKIFGPLSPVAGFTAALDTGAKPISTNAITIAVPVQFLR